MSSKAELEKQVSHTAGRLWDLFKDAEERIALQEARIKELAMLARQYVRVVEDVIPESTFELNGALEESSASLYVKVYEILGNDSELGL